MTLRCIGNYACDLANPKKISINPATKGPSTLDYTRSAYLIAVNQFLFGPLLSQTQFHFCHSKGQGTGRKGRLTSRLDERARMYTSVLVQEDMPRLRDQVTGGSFSQTALEATRPLVKKSPGVLLAYHWVERLEDLLQRHAVSSVQLELSCCTLAHHSSPAHTSIVNQSHRPARSGKPLHSQLSSHHCSRPWHWLHCIFAVYNKQNSPENTTPWTVTVTFSPKRSHTEKLFPHTNLLTPFSEFSNANVARTRSIYSCFCLCRKNVG